ncbi:uncharacterized protein LOC130975492 [Arachis stenosperma]|uniref:uncharacterized protein LOC130975492 n=1 Tax=Arachis stenosperma TaxID=217475 RepID=UPI0025ACADFF|nr:uncharacterized protein LOC130975492 [Arachis stenosperma]
MRRNPAGISQNADTKNGPVLGITSFIATIAVPRKKNGDTSTVNSQSPSARHFNDSPSSKLVSATAAEDGRSSNSCKLIEGKKRRRGKQGRGFAKSGKKGEVRGGAVGATATVAAIANKGEGRSEREERVTRRREMRPHCRHALPPSRRRLTEGEDCRASLPRHHRTRAQREREDARKGATTGSHHRLSPSQSVGPSPFSSSPTSLSGRRCHAVTAPSSSSQSQPPPSFHNRRVSPRLRASPPLHLGRRCCRSVASRCLTGASVANDGGQWLPEDTIVVAAEGERSRAAVLAARRSLVAARNTAGDAVTGLSHSFVAPPLSPETATKSPVLRCGFVLAFRARSLQLPHFVILDLVTEVACCKLELFMLLQKCVGLCFEAAFGLG